MNNKNWYTYILECSDKSYYIGITNNIRKRVEIHNSGKGSKYILMRRPVRLVYFEKFNNRSKAQKREIQLKSWTRKEKQKLIKNLH